MPKLKNRIVRFLILSALVFSTLILIVATGIRTLAAHDSVREDAESAFDRLDTVLTDGMDDRGRLSQYLSLLQLGSGVSLYAVEPRAWIITCATNEQDIGKLAANIGLPTDPEGSDLYVENATVNGKYSYCIAKRMHGLQISYVISRSAVYSTIFKETMMMAASLYVITALLVIAVAWYINRHVIRSIYRLNSSLDEITQGNYVANVYVSNTAEFRELGDHINDMINSLLSTTDLLSYIFSKTDIHVGVYVYNSRMKYVRFTDYIPELLNLEPEAMTATAADYQRFRDYIAQLRSQPVGGDKNLFRIDVRGKARYIRIEEEMHRSDVFGVVIDMTAEVEKRRRIESERDMDLLTGLLNRRGMKNRMGQLFRSPEELGYGAVIMIDADDLKEINDVYGHSQGDRYLKALADVLSRFGRRENLSARLGGDEFVVFLYGYESDAELQEDLAAFVGMQDQITIQLGDSDELTIRFSLGYSLTHGENNYSVLLHDADERMYENKRRRKGGEDDETPPLFR